MTNGQTMHTLPGSSQFPTTRWTLVVSAGAPDQERSPVRFSFPVRGLLVSVIRLYSPPRLSG